MLDIDKELKLRLLKVNDEFSDYSERELLLLNFVGNRICRNKIKELKSLVLFCSFVIVIILCWILFILFNY